MDTFSPAKKTALGILVNGTEAIKAVQAILHAAGIRDEEVVVGLGGDFQSQFVAAYRGKADGVIIQKTICIEIGEGDEENRFDVSKRHRAGHGDVMFCKAVPDSLAWVFADNISLSKKIPDKELASIVARLPLPEQIPFPEMILEKFEEAKIDIYAIISSLDIGVAAARSPALRVFLETVFDALGRPMPEIREAYSRNLNRDIIANLMAEVSQPDTPVFRAADGATYTAEQMIRHIREGSPIGQQYASDLLRVSRDMLARQAKRAG